MYEGKQGNKFFQIVCICSLWPHQLSAVSDKKTMKDKIGENKKEWYGFYDIH